MIRSVTAHDIVWLVALAERCHDPKEMPAGGQWITAMVEHPQVIGVRGEHSAGFARVSRPPWRTDETNCELMHLFSAKSSRGRMEALEILRAIDYRRLRRGCDKFYIVSTRADLTPFAERMGARSVGSLHVLGAAA